MNLISGLRPSARPWALAHLEAIHASGKLPKNFRAKITSGYRSPAEQNALYAQGRTTPGKIVTRARAWQSIHNYGFAWDITIFDAKGNPVWEDDLYRAIAPSGKALGLEWGGDWSSFKDFPHYEVPCELSIGQLRSLIERGKGIPLPQYDTHSADGPKVRVFDGGIDTGVTGEIIDGRVWLPSRKFAQHFGGDIVEAVGADFKIALHGTVITLTGMIRNRSEGWAMFRDLNLLYGFEFTYLAGRLSIF